MRKMGRPSRATASWAAATAVAVTAVAAAAVAATAAAAAAAALPPWRPLPQPPTPRQESSLARCGVGRLCLTGGRDGAAVQVLHLPSRRWAAGAPPPVPLHHVQDATGPDGCLWSAGAYTGGWPSELPVDRIWTYCADGGGGGGWAARPGRISRPRGAGGAAWHRGKLYLVGGLVGGHGAAATTVGWTDVYDPPTRRWGVLPAMPHPRDHFGVAVVGDQLLAVGGRVSGLAGGGAARMVPEVDVRPGRGWW